MAELDDGSKRDAEAALQRLPGVLGAHVRLDGGRIEAVFIQSDGSRDARKTVRDVEAVLAARHGVEIDYRKISVAVTPPGVAGASAPGPAPRLEFANVRVEQSGLSSEARVELHLGEAHVLGIARGPATRTSSAELVAEACLQAAERFIEDPVVFALGAVDRLRLGRDRVIVVSVRLLRGREEKLLTGSCPGESDDQRAVAYATLDALNRTFGLLSVREPVLYVVRSEAGGLEQGSASEPDPWRVA